MFLLSQQTEPDQNDIATSQDSSMGSVKAEQPETIEETLNSLENHQTTQSLPDELDAFLVRKTDGRMLQQSIKKESDQESERQDDDDGNDTDDLLRVLGDGDQKTAKEDAEKTKDGESSDDDEFVFEGAKTRTLQVAKDALMRASASKAVPEDDDPTDCSSDDASTMKKMFNVREKKPEVSKATTTSTTKMVTTNSHTSQKTSLVKKVVNVPHKPAAQPAKPSILKQYVHKKSSVTAASAPQHRRSGHKAETNEHGLEEDDNDLNKAFNHRDSKSEKQTQRLMRPEVMDEEVPTDPDTDSDEESLYDELPSSDSENMDDWFTLDIRAERAGDYIPLLGDKAYQLLLDEKRRVAAKLETLKTSLSSLAASGKEQAERLREVTATAAELDAMLRAS
ncbi:uncharacterized protein LOC126378916 isoform X2 [Pectinophora gossypiella]|uniref:uncharacterized protein LOC126378916 isoform X2 n=1 Tax=Pectinophora gossypiella TaxID=13191 RepID=UPI00214ED546|nr:uncharacterized protein LOC126378916 isoform X2 [Pectinophora gossypiella]